MKSREEKMANMKAKIQNWFDKTKRKEAWPPPRYDKVFYDGLARLIEKDNDARLLPGGLADFGSARTVQLVCGG